MMRARVTLRIEPDLLTEARRVAASESRTLNSVIEEALREFLARRRLASAR
jgi:hypothetical protein